MYKTTYIITILLLVIVIMHSCTKDKAMPAIGVTAFSDLFTEISAAGFTFYQGGTLLSAASPSPHGAFKLRFNDIALAALDASGELPAGSSFPTGSVIVKDAYKGNDIFLYAVMKKDPSNANAGNGWIWAEYNPDGSVFFSAEKKGNGCISCHSGIQNRDLVMTFDLH